jgi:hypothetical protein
MDSNNLTPEQIEKFPRVTEILKATGIADFAQIPNIEYYLQRGTDVHQICADIAQGGIPDYWTGSELEGYAVGFQSFLADTRFKPQLIEHSVHHPLRRYRGTMDYLGTFGDDPTLVLPDLKSGIVAEWVKLQTAAYASCLPNPEKIRRMGLQLKKNGTYALSPEYKDYRTDSQYFFSLVAAVHGRTLYGKTAVVED